MKLGWEATGSGVMCEESPYKKCVWKVRKIGFLGVVIGPDRIEMEKEKVEGVLS